MNSPYVTYLPNGKLDGYFVQNPPEDHLGRMIEVSEDIAFQWGNYQANESRDGVELSPQSPRPPEPVPQSVSMRQARLALLGIEKLDDVDQAINGLPSPNKERARIEWDYSSSVDRNRPFVLTLGAALGLDDKALDNLFIEASKL